MKKTTMKSMFQVGVVSWDTQKTLDNWRKYFNIDEATLIQKNTKDLAEKGQYGEMKYYGKPTEFWINICRFDMGGLDFEIIETH